MKNIVTWAEVIHKCHENAHTKIHMSIIVIGGFSLSYLATMCAIVVKNDKTSQSWYTRNMLLVLRYIPLATR